MTLLNVEPADVEKSRIFACRAAVTGKEVKSVKAADSISKKTWTFPAKPPATFDVPGLEVDLL